MGDTTIWDEVCKRIDPVISDFLDKEGLSDNDAFSDVCDITYETGRVAEFRRTWRNRQTT